MKPHVTPSGRRALVLGSGILFLLWVGVMAQGFPGQAFADAGHPVPRAWKGEWGRTDFSRHSVDLSEVISGGPPKDGIPPIDAPKFVPAQKAREWLDPLEPVIVYEHKGDIRAYPLQILMWHEIVNDSVAGRPIVVTFCPLCNAALVFDRKVGGKELSFGTTGKLRMSDLVMWDRQTESWWQQLTGEAIIGKMTGTRLEYLPAPTVAFRTFVEIHPRGRVLSRDTGHARDYGRNPYAGYDRGSERPFMMRGALDRRLPFMERVVSMESGAMSRAYPFTELAKVRVVQDRLGDLNLVIFYDPSAKSALDASRISESRNVGAAAVFSPSLDGRRLKFQSGKGRITDRETGSTWNLLGEAVKGPLRGKRLEKLPHGTHFAFAWLAFRPKSDLWRAR